MLATIQHAIFELEKWRIAAAEVQLPGWALQYLMEEYATTPASIIRFEDGSVSIWGIKLTRSPVNSSIMRVLSVKEVGKVGRGMFVDVPLEKHDVLWGKYGA